MWDGGSGSLYRAFMVGRVESIGWEQRAGRVERGADLDFALGALMGSGDGTFKLVILGLRTRASVMHWLGRVWRKRSIVLPSFAGEEACRPQDLWLTSF